MNNLGGANAGAITAALFLVEFVGDVPWAHIDIAGTAQSDGRHRRGRPPGAPASAPGSWSSWPSTSRRRTAMTRRNEERTGRDDRTVDTEARRRRTGLRADACSTGSSGSGNKVPHPAIIFLGLSGW